MNNILKNLPELTQEVEKYIIKEASFNNYLIQSPQQVYEVLTVPFYRWKNRGTGSNHPPDE